MLLLATYFEGSFSKLPFFMLNFERFSKQLLSSLLYICIKLDYNNLK